MAVTIDEALDKIVAYNDLHTTSQSINFLSFARSRYGTEMEERVLRKKIE